MAEDLENLFSRNEAVSAVIVFSEISGMLTNTVSYSTIRSILTSVSVFLLDVTWAIWPQATNSKREIKRLKFFIGWSKDHFS